MKNYNFSLQVQIDFVKSELDMMGREYKQLSEQGKIDPHAANFRYFM